MADQVAQAVQDAALDKVATATRVVLCSADPVNFAGIAAVALGNYVITAGDGGGDWTHGAGDVSGRKTTLGAQSGNNATASGAGVYVVVDDGALLLAGADCATVNTTSGQPFNIAAWDAYEVNNPT